MTFDYHGKHRVVAPYCYGVSAKGGEVLRALQVGGGSSSGGYDPNYNPNDSAMKQVICRIE